MNIVKILVVDTNRVYAKEVKKIIEQHVSNSSVDIASNFWEVKRRTEKNRYNLIFADLSVTMDEMDIMDELSKHNSKIIKWSIIDNKSNVKKPNHLHEIPQILNCLQNCNF